MGFSNISPSGKTFQFAEGRLCVRVIEMQIRIWNRTPLHRLAVRSAIACSILLYIPTTTNFSFGQYPESQPSRLAYGTDPANVPLAFAKVKSGNFGLVDVDIIARARALEAIPTLKEQFEQAQDQLTKAKLASALVILGDKDDAYWNFLVQFVTPAILSDAPDFMGHDSNGKTVAEPSPQFTQWANAHRSQLTGTPPEDSLYMQPAKVMLLGSTGDPRAVPLLRRALASPNHQIEAAAAMGLSEIQDRDSIPLIIRACNSAPRESAAEIAKSLVYFDDENAQRAVEIYMSTDAAQAERQKRARGRTPFR
jgi:hypothetical protein